MFDNGEVKNYAGTVFLSSEEVRERHLQPRWVVLRYRFICKCSAEMVRRLNVLDHQTALPDEFIQSYSSMLTQATNFNLFNQCDANSNS